VEDELLGKRVAQHRTDNGRRRRIAVAFLVAAGVGLVAGVPLSIAYFAVPWGPTSEDPRNWSGLGLLSGGLVGLGLLFGCFGFALLAKAVRTKDETFEVYEQGIVHRVGDAVAVISWSDISSVRLHGSEQTGGPHYLGIDFYCVLRLTNGRRLKFNTYTSDAPTLAAKIDAAVNRGTRPEPR
jgi:hypothetical protein